MCNAGGERGADQAAALQYETESHYAVGAQAPREDGDEGCEEHGDGEVKSADEGVVPGRGRGEEGRRREVVGEVDAVGLDTIDLVKLFFFLFGSFTL